MVANNQADRSYRNGVIFFGGRVIHLKGKYVSILLEFGERNLSRTKEKR